MEHDYLLIGHRFVLNKQLGAGTFGEIYFGIDQNEPAHSPHRLVAIKLEHRDRPNQLLKYEANIYKYLYQADKGVPRLYWSGVQDDYNVLVIEMLGPSLERLYTLCNRKFSLKTTVIVAREMIRRINYVHSRGVVHRDIKPENFLIGLNNNDVYIIDFGLCKLFKNKTTPTSPPPTIRSWWAPSDTPHSTVTKDWSCLDAMIWSRSAMS